MAAEPLSDAALDRIFRDAHAMNHYADRPIGDPAAVAQAIWDLVKWGPTSANQEPARFLWCASAEARDRLAACASGSNAEKIRAAPLAVIVAMDLDFAETLPVLFPHTDARAWFAGKPELTHESAFRNSTLQGAYLIVAARALGLDVGPMSGFDAAAVDDAFFAGTRWRSNFIATLGHGRPDGFRARLPRLAFDEANRLA